MRRVLIVQARMTSSRLPGKVLLDLEGAPMLERQLQRLSRCSEIDETVLAVTSNPQDDPLVDLARRLDVTWYRGSEHDVLSRYLGAARAARADLIVRVTSDCPLLDAGETDAVVRALQAEPATYDYAANHFGRRMPRGLDVEALWSDALERTARMASSRQSREHVTWFCYGERPDLFALLDVRRPLEAPDLRWTVDTADDLTMVRRLYSELALAERDVPIAEIVAYVRAHPALAEINAQVPQKDPAA